MCCYCLERKSEKIGGLWDGYVGREQMDDVGEIEGIGASGCGAGRCNGGMSFWMGSRVGCKVVGMVWVEAWTGERLTEQVSACEDKRKGWG